MKVRNKLGLKLSRWVGYTELPAELLIFNNQLKDSYHKHNNSFDQLQKPSSKSK